MRFFKITGVKDFQHILDERDIRTFVGELLSLTENDCFREDVRYFRKAEQCLLESLLLYIRHKSEYMKGSPMDALISLLGEMLSAPYFSSEDTDDHLIDEEMEEFALRTMGTHPAVIKYRMFKNAASNIESEVVASCYERVKQIVPDISTGITFDSSSEFSEFFIKEKPRRNEEPIQIM